MDRKRFVILVADSVGCGELPDAAAYGDAGSDTLGNTSRAVGGLALPNLGRLGLGHTTSILGVPADPAPAGFHGKMAERSEGKDTITGHWEMMGVVLREGLATFPDGFPPEIIEPFVAATGVIWTIDSGPLASTGGVIGVDDVEVLASSDIYDSWTCTLPLREGRGNLPGCRRLTRCSVN